MTPFSKETAAKAKAFRISPTDTNYFAVLFDPEKDGVRNLFIVEIRNTGASKLYCLTVMTPNEGFAELIRAGEPVELDEEDLRVLAA
jgi:hypothetical protein